MHLSPLVSDWLVGEDEDRFPAPPPVVQAIPARLVDVRNAVHMANWWGVVFMFVSICSGPYLTSGNSSVGKKEPSSFPTSDQ
jgi:hypothetical protein